MGADQREPEIVERTERDDLAQQVVTLEEKVRALHALAHDRAQEVYEAENALTAAEAQRDRLVEAVDAVIAEMVDAKLGSAPLVNGWRQILATARQGTA